MNYVVEILEYKVKSMNDLIDSYIRSVNNKKACIDNYEVAIAECKNKLKELEDALEKLK